MNKIPSPLEYMLTAESDNSTFSSEQWECILEWKDVFNDAFAEAKDKPLLSPESSKYLEVIWGFARAFQPLPGPSFILRYNPML